MALTEQQRDKLQVYDNKKKDSSKKKDERYAERNWASKQLREATMGRSRGKETSR